MRHKIFASCRWSASVQTGAKWFLLPLLTSCLLLACSCKAPSHVDTSQSSKAASSVNVGSSTDQERDEIAMLLAYSVVLKDWQTNGPNKRGYNIGCVLVDSNNQIVHSGLNSNHATRNTTQHGEVRAILDYLDALAAADGPGGTNQKPHDLRGITIYTTLEPCAMCSGMMTLSSASGVCYGQADPLFGKALERLQLDSSHFLRGTGYEPYPRPVPSTPSALDIRKRLESAHLKSGLSITEFLYSDQARQLYEEAAAGLQQYSVRHPENAAFLQSAREFLKTVPDHFVPLNVHF